MLQIPRPLVFFIVYGVMLRCIVSSELEQNTTCPRPPAIANGTVSCYSSNTTNNKWCAVTCDEGFEPDTLARFTCLEGGVWSTIPKCLEMRCPSLPTLDHGFYMCSQQNSTAHGYGHVCTVTCSHGYKPSSSDTNITCTNEGVWSHHASCVEIACPNPPKVYNGVYKCNQTMPHTSTTYKLYDMCQLQCSHGFKPKSDYSDITCLSNDQWSTPSSCQRKKCPSLPTVQNGVYRCANISHSGYWVHEVCQLHCLPGYKPDSSSSDIKCQDTEQWSDHSHCLEMDIKCPAPPKVANGSYHCDRKHTSTYKMNDVCHLTCRSGFKPNSLSSDITCRFNKQWSRPSTCLDMKCPVPPPVAHGVYECALNTNDNNQSVECHLNCDIGLKPRSISSAINCLSDKTWSTPSSCVGECPLLVHCGHVKLSNSKIKCPQPPRIPHGGLHCLHSQHHGYRLDDECQIQCQKGYRSNSTSSSIKCLASETWSDSPSCVEVKCPVLPKVKNGTYVCEHVFPHATSYKLDTLCHLHCQPGFRPASSSSDITCTISDQWSAPSSCVRMNCPAPPKVTHGKYTCSPSNDVCHLECNHGYRPSAIQHGINCLPTDKWSTAATCVEKKCPAPPSVSYGGYQCDAHNRQCRLHCAASFRPSSHSTTIHCLSTYKWSAPGSCIANKCPAPPNVTNGEYHCHATGCSLICNQRFQPASATTNIHCLATGKWSAAGTCVEMKCHSLPNVTNGAYECLNGVCTLKCKTGFRLRDTAPLKCLPHNHWSAQSSCVEVQCPPPPKVPHGTYHCANTDYKLRDMCYLQCSPGFAPSRGLFPTICLDSGTWSTTDTCVEATCPAPPKVANGVYVCLNNNHNHNNDNQTIHVINEICFLHCNHGFTTTTVLLTPSSYIKCMPNHHWSPPGRCIEVKCSAPPKVNHGVYQCPKNTNRLSDACHLQCNSGYKPSTDNSDIRCLATHKWSAPSSCVETCSGPPVVPNGVYHCINPTLPSTDHRQNNTCTLRCKWGLKPNSTSSDITCLSSNQWSPVSSCVAIMCPSPPKVTDGVYQCPHSNHHSTTHKLNEICHLQCNTGFRPSTPSSDIKCLSSEHWSKPHTCEEIECRAPPDITNGKYHCSNTTHKLNDVCQLQCTTGYRPSSTSTDIHCLSTETWSAPGTCQAIMCPSPPKVTDGVYLCPHSNHHSTTHKLNEICHLQCNAGFRPSTPSSDIKCLSSEQWSKAHTCEEIECRAPPDVTNGKYHCSNTTHKLNDVCHLQCTTGYRPSSTSTDIHCLSTETWSAPGTCLEIECRAPPDVTNGKYHCSNTTHKLNDVCHLQCTTGYRPSSTSTDIHCLSTETWSAPGTCLAIMCPSPPKVTDGVYQCPHSNHHSTTHKLNEICHLQCNAGFRPSTPSSDIKCLSSEQWSKPHTCVEIQCPVPPPVTNGELNCHNSTSHKVNDSCELRCNNGYKPSTNSADIHCLPSGNWSSQITCIAIMCPSPPKVTDGVYQCPHSNHHSTTHKLNEVCHLQCNAGFRPRTTSADIKCLSSEQWSKSHTCVEIECQAPPDVTNGKYHCSNTTHKLNDVCHLQCTTGYRPSSTSTDIHCLSTETWSEPGTCQEIQCPVPPPVRNGELSCDNSTFHKVNDSCELCCDYGYKPNTNSADIYCLPSGNWSSQINCIEIQCPLPRTIPHGKFSCTSRRMDDLCRLQCDHGYKSTSSYIQCLPTEIWSAHAPCNEIQCSTPPVVTNGVYHCGKSTSHKLGDVCHLQCNDGYNPNSDSADIHCLSTEKWSTPASCKRSVEALVG